MGWSLGRRAGLLPDLGNEASTSAGEFRVRYTSRYYRPIAEALMLDKEDLVRLLEYTVWANHRILRPVATLTVADFRRDLSSSHGGVRGTLTHMMSAEWIWLERWKGVSPTRMLDEGEFPDVVVLRERWTVVEKHRAAWLAALKEGEVAEIVRYQSTQGKPHEAPLWQLVQHLVNHSTFHRGQVAALLRLLDTPPLETDLVAWDRDREAKARRGRSAAR